MSEVWQQIIEMSKYGQKQSEQRATRVLSGYFKMMAERAGMRWDSDNVAEIDGVVSDIVTAATLAAVAQVLGQLTIDQQHEAAQ